MADIRMTVLEALRNALRDADMDFLRQTVKVIAETLMDLEVTERIGAERYERTETRVNARNGSRKREWDTRVGTIELAIPKLRRGSYFPGFLEPRRRAEKALVNVVLEAYLKGVSTRKVDGLVKALGLDGMGKDEVSRIARELDESVRLFRERPLTGFYPYLWLDATYIRSRENGRVVNTALVVAVAVNQEGKREVLGFDMGPSEDAEFWTSFLRSLVQRGLRGVKLVISDAHVGLRQAIQTVLQNASWQRCRVHLARNILVHVSKGAQSEVADLVRSIFEAPDADTAKARLREVVEKLEFRFPKAAKVLEEAEADALAFMAFPPEHRRRLQSTNLLERLNREIKRRGDVVGIFPNSDASLRLLGAILIEQHEEWSVGRVYLNPEPIAAFYESHDEEKEGVSEESVA